MNMNSKEDKSLRESVLSKYRCPNIDREKEKCAWAEAATCPFSHTLPYSKLQVMPHYICRPFLLGQCPREETPIDPGLKECPEGFHPEFQDLGVLSDFHRKLANILRGNEPKLKCKICHKLLTPPYAILENCQCEFHADCLISSRERRPTIKCPAIEHHHSVNMVISQTLFHSPVVKQNIFALQERVANLMQQNVQPEA